MIIHKIFGKNGPSLIEILFLHFIAGSGENYKNFSLDNRIPGRDLIREPPEEESRALQLRHSAWYEFF
jgi:hypothetical protein